MVVRFTKRERREWAAMVRGDHPEQQSYNRYVLGQLRIARAKARMLMQEIDVIGVALKSGAIDADAALRALWEARALDFLQPSEPPWGSSDDVPTTPIELSQDERAAGE
jgi:hypothetical protein